MSENEPTGVPPFDESPGPERLDGPQTLEYGGARPYGAYVPRTPNWVQFLLGMIAPFVGTFGSGWSAVALGARDTGMLWAGGLGFAAVFIVGIVARVRFGWKAFLPGALTGIGLALLAVGLCFAIVCGGL